MACCLSDEGWLKARSYGNEEVKGQGHIRLREMRSLTEETREEVQHIIMRSWENEERKGHEKMDGKGQGREKMKMEEVNASWGHQGCQCQETGFFIKSYKTIERSYQLASLPESNMICEEKSKLNFLNLIKLLKIILTTDQKLVLNKEVPSRWQPWVMRKWRGGVLWVIKINGLSGDSGQQGPYSPYKPCNHSLYIGISIRKWRGNGSKVCEERGQGEMRWWENEKGKSQG